MERVPVLIGEVKVARAENVLYAVGLGSCVAIVLYDPQRRVGGLAHSLLPAPLNGRDGAQPGRYVSTAIAELVARMQGLGAAQGRLRARLAGGSAMFSSVLPESGRRLGMRNIEAARRALGDAGIPVEGEDVGGTHGRSVYLDVAAGSVRITSVHHSDVIL